MSVKRRPWPVFLASILFGAAVLSGSYSHEVISPLTPLANRPLPPNGNLCRAMYVWMSHPDPLATDAAQQELVNFCGTNGVNLLFLDIWPYLCGGNWTNAKAARVRQFLDAAHRSGIRVHALVGDLGYAVQHRWFMRNILEPFIAFNAMATGPSEQFDGMSLDVEYYQNETLYPMATHLPGLCDLVKAIRSRAGNRISVGCFVGFFQKDNTGQRPLVLYNGKWAQDGEHLMDTCDYVVVGAYRDTGSAQISVSQAWYDYAKGQGRNFGLLIASETISIEPAYITYYGATKAQMEAEHTTISNSFSSDTNSVFMGQAVHEYAAWKGMR